MVDALGDRISVSIKSNPDTAKLTLPRQRGKRENQRDFRTSTFRYTLSLGRKFKTVDVCMLELVLILKAPYLAPLKTP